MILWRRLIRLASSSVTVTFLCIPALLSGLLCSSTALLHGDTLPLGGGKSRPRLLEGLFSRVRADFPVGVALSVWASGQTKGVVFGFCRTKPGLRVWWPDSSIMVTLEDAKRVVWANGLPSHATGDFPIRSGSRAYSYDRNPNCIRKKMRCSSFLHIAK